MEAEQTPLVIERSKDGYWFDPETGEIFGHSDLESDADVLAAIADAERKPRFAVVDLQSAEWVLGKMQEADAEILSITARQTAQHDHLEALRRAQVRRKEWLIARFASDLEAFAAGQLAGAKTRTLTTPYGKLSFRKSPGSIEVTDMDGAIAWAEEYAPAAVKISKSILKQPLKGREAELPTNAFEVREPADTFHITTGIKEA